MQSSYETFLSSNGHNCCNKIVQAFQTLKVHSETKVNISKHRNYTPTTHGNDKYYRSLTNLNNKTSDIANTVVIVNVSLDMHTCAIAHKTAC